MMHTLSSLLFALTPTDDPSTHRLRIHGDLTLVDGQLDSYDGALHRIRRWSFGQPNVGLGVGGQIVPWLWLGGRVTGAARTDYYNIPEAGPGRRGTTFHLGLDPYVEVRPMPSRTIQPFVMAHAGIRYVEHRFTYDESTVHKFKNLAAQVGGRIGLHAFVLPRLSVDADVGVKHGWDLPAFQNPGNSTNLHLTGRLGISGWW